MLYFLLKDYIEFPLLGLMLNSVYYALITFGISVTGVLTYRRLIAFNHSRKKILFLFALILVISIPSGYIGSRAADMFYYPPNMWSLHFFWDQFHKVGHHTFHGFFMLSVMSTLVLMKILRFDLFKTMDALFLYIPLGYTFGRLGCFLAGCCFGHNLSISIFDTHFVFKNPVPLYSIGINIILFFLLRKCFNFIYTAQSRYRFSGAVTALYLIIYGTTRYALEFIRTENKIILGLTQAQIVMMIFIGTGCLILVRKKIS